MTYTTQSVGKKEQEELKKRKATAVMSKDSSHL